MHIITCMEGKALGLDTVCFQNRSLSGSGFIAVHQTTFTLSHIANKLSKEMPSGSKGSL